ncbi:MAG: hypothetical protein Q9227_001473 [Pyrenula ochraceoflavens]
MYSSTLLAGLSLALSATPVSAFWRLPCKVPLLNERADPIISPDQVSGHVHTIMGGNAFTSAGMDYAKTQTSTCSSCTVQKDLSNYWSPRLYYQAKNGSFISVGQNGGATVYYLQRPGPKNDKLQAFPEGFRMVAGSPFKRSGNSTDHATQAVSYACLDYNGPATAETNNFPTRNCPDGLRSQVFFPSCWDGKNLDSPDHSSHMAYPIEAYNSGSCPDTHPVHLVSIFYEIIWNTPDFADMWYGEGQPFVWSMGDPTGYGFHGDFINGWDVTHLQSAIDTCTSDSGRVEDCPVFTSGGFSLTPDAHAEACTLTPTVNEQVFGVMDKLPGCNPVTFGPGDASPATGGNCGGVVNGTGSGNVGSGNGTVGGTIMPSGYTGSSGFASPTSGYGSSPSGISNASAGSGAAGLPPISIPSGGKAQSSSSSASGSLTQPSDSSSTSDSESDASPSDSISFPSNSSSSDTGSTASSSSSSSGSDACSAAATTTTTITSIFTVTASASNALSTPADNTAFSTDAPFPDTAKNGTTNPHHFGTGTGTAGYPLPTGTGGHHRHPAPMDEGVKKGQHLAEHRRNRHRRGGGGGLLGREASF